MWIKFFFKLSGELPEVWRHRAKKTEKTARTMSRGKRKPHAQTKVHIYRHHVEETLKKYLFMTNFILFSMKCLIEQITH